MTDIYNIIKNLNDQAYQYVYDIWTDADKLEGPLADERRGKIMLEVLIIVEVVGLIWYLSNQ